MTRSTHFRRLLSVPILAVGLLMGCAPQASNPADSADPTQTSAAAQEAGGSGTKSDVSSGSGSK